MPLTLQYKASMSLNQSAEENLRVIRSLMERTATYRAISVPSATWAGIVSVAAFLLNLWLIQAGDVFFSFEGFLIIWLGVLVLASIGNTVILFRESRRTGTTFPSRALLSAIGGMTPAFLAAAVLTGSLAFLDFTRADNFMFSYVAVALWMLFYGIGLLGTQHFAPRSIILLGWAFLLGSFVVMITTLLAFSIFLEMKNQGNPIYYFPSAIMAITFGGFHLVYAALVARSIRAHQDLTVSQH